MKRVLFIMFIVIAVPLLCSGQKVVKTATGNFIQSKTSTRTKFTDTLTNITYTNNKGQVYPVFKGAKGKYYVGRVSKSGKYYRQYLKTE